MKKSYLVLVLLLPLLLLGISPMQSMRATHRSPQSLANGYRISEVINSEYDMENWVPDTRMNYYYPNSQTDSPDSLLYDFWNGGWEDGFMVSYISYTPDGRVTEVMTESRVPGFESPQMKVTFLYDAQNRLTHMYQYQADMALDSAKDRQWILMNWLQVVYGSGTEFEFYSYYNEGPWGEGWSHTVFEFDVRGRMIEEIEYSSADSSNWVIDSKYTTDYHPADTGTGQDIIDYFAHDFARQMIYQSYDMTPLMISEGMYYDFNGTEYVPEEMTNWTYDANLRRIDEIVQERQGTEWVWLYKDSYAYDANGNLSTATSYDGVGAQWQEYSRIQYTWESYTSNSDDLLPPVSGISINAYPSPFKDALTLETQSKEFATTDYSIYNSKGQLVRNLHASPNSSIQWDGKDKAGQELGSGIYFIKANQAQNSAIKRIIKLK